MSAIPGLSFLSSGPVRLGEATRVPQEYVYRKTAGPSPCRWGALLRDVGRDASTRYSSLLPFAMSGEMPRLATLLFFLRDIGRDAPTRCSFLRYGPLDACPQDCTNGASLATLDPHVPYRTGCAEEVGDSIGDSVGDA